MMAGQFVVDNSVVMSWCFEDECSAYGDRVLRSLEDNSAIVPSIWPLEAGNVLLVAERRKRLSQADAARFLSLLEQLPIEVRQESPRRMFNEVLSVGREFKLSTYDASYLELAMRSGFPLATEDKNLRSAARKCEVLLYKP